MILDINHARIVHLEWEMKLEDIIRTGGKAIQVSTHDQCMLGAWLYTEGLKSYKHLPEIMLLEEHHATFHQLAQKVINEHAKKNDELAAQHFKQVKILSREIIFLLTKVELKLIDKQKRKDKLLAPLRFVGKLFK